MDAFDWECPFCGRNATITDESVHIETIEFRTENAKGPRDLKVIFTVCPNSKCKKFTLHIELHELEKKLSPFVPTFRKLINEWQLVPPSNAHTFPDYIPTAILNDYQEACLIVNLSPKASATLSRRCLQGIVRDFWKVRPGKLFEEIEQIRDRIDPKTWEAIDAVRKVGNIGAHMEKEINLR
ncbi:MAG: DUF4145 domain-containing protein [bacterium]